MRTITLITALVVPTIFCAAQVAGGHPGRVPQHIAELRASGTPFHSLALFHALEATPERDALWQDALDHAVLLAPDQASLAAVLVERPAQAMLALPMEHGEFLLDLELAHPFSDDFSVVTASTGQAFDYAQGLHYQGSVQGDPRSLVAISIFKDEVMGFVSTADGDWTIGRLEGDAAGTHVLYRTSALREPPAPVCATADDGQGYTHEQLSVQGDGRTAKCVRAYWEVNYDIFQGKGSVANATNYVTGLFNQSQVLYNNDGISMTLSQVYVWDVASPYTATSTSTLLDQFGAYRTSFNGDIAMLLGYAGGGGIAWLSGLCVSNIAHRMGYAGISSTYQTVPTYSWSVEVVTHEQGHILGSRHTHACAWNGNNTAIDGCGPTAGYTEGTCATAALPSGGGTIMSYCHLVGGVGINFNNGFGPQPTTVIVNAINNASCLTTCSGGTCGAPSGLSAANLTTTTATLSWSAVSGATSYNLQWKAASAGNWTTVSGLTGTSYALSGLVAATSYQFQVMTTCSGGGSAYSAASTFTTAGATGCPDIQEPNNTTATAGAIVPGATYNALIASASDADHYKLVTTGTTNITVTLGNLPFDYDIALLNAGGTQLASSTNGGTTAESMTYSNAAAGTYYIKVYGYNGAFSTTACYALTATATAVSSCTDNFEPNETNGGARTVGSNSTNTARIGSTTDVDWFKFANTSAQKNIKVTLTNLPANYNMRLYRASGLLATSANSGTSNEQIIYNSSTVSSNYKVNVYGASGAFNASACYTLTVQISATAFMPEGAPEATVADVVPVVEDGAITIYPNPANEVLNVLIPAGEATAQVDLLDAIGRTVNSFTSQAVNAEQRVVLDIRTLNPGVYFLRARRGGAEQVQRLMVQR